MPVDIRCLIDVILYKEEEEVEETSWEISAIICHFVLFS